MGIDENRPTVYELIIGIKATVKWVVKTDAREVGVDSQQVGDQEPDRQFQKIQGETTEE